MELKTKLLINTEWVESLNIHDNSQGKHTDPVKNISIYLCLTSFSQVTICYVFYL